LPSFPPFGYCSLLIREGRPVAGRRTDVLDVREILRRLRLGQGVRAVARDMAVSRKTVSRYRDWACGVGLLEGDLPEPGELDRRLRETLPVTPPPRRAFKAERHRERIVQLRSAGVECRAILERLREEVGYQGSYGSVYRFVRHLEPLIPEAFVRVETPAGEEAQVDFGSAGTLLDPATGSLRRAWVFVMTLSFSRHQYVELVFDQSVATWLRCHRNAFSFFRGVPRRVVVDNLKAAITRAVLHDPVVQRAYRECAEHYGFLISPCRPRTPRHKGKVEKGGVHYVKRNFLAGSSFRDIHDANERALVWCTETAGKRVHGTTKRRPVEVFDAVEREALQPVPPAAYVPSTWKQAKLHPDCHVVFEGSFYSAPHRFIGRRLWVRAADRAVTLYVEHDSVATHARATRKGQRLTNRDHLPPEKVAGLMACPASCLRRAAEIGRSTSELLGRLLGERPLDRLRTAMGILRLAHKYSPRRLEAACARSLLFDEISYGAVKRILERGLDLAGPPATALSVEPAQPFLFVRPWTDFFAEGR
jgi:transposase